MSNMFEEGLAYKGDMSKWDVSRVANMDLMFLNAPLFKSDLSKWNVSNATTMHGMFTKAASFNSDISEWDVSSVTDMEAMFDGARAFSQKLCGAAWINSKANKDRMFAGSSGSIGGAGCTMSTADPSFSPQSRSELKDAVDAHAECMSE